MAISAPPRYVTVPPGDDVMAVLVAARREPLLADALNALLENKFAWPASLKRIDHLPAIAGNTADTRKYVAVRDDDFEFPDAFQAQIEGLFGRCYYAVMFPCFGKNAARLCGAVTPVGIRGAEDACREQDQSPDMRRVGRGVCSGPRPAGGRANAAARCGPPADRPGPLSRIIHRPIVTRSVSEGHTSS